ncbi:MAG: TIGR00300 family protein [candidate division Zixibacteria bacterium]|nr:TIGR00300 family protein [candidate division Zixibacteria bacterium]
MGTRPYHATVTAEGHLVDSGVLSEAMDQIVRGGASFAVKEFTLGATNLQPSRAVLEIQAPSRGPLERVLGHLVDLGFYTAAVAQLVVRRAPKDGAAPEGFYSTTNHATQVYLDGRWQRVRDQRMDSAIVLDPGPRCRKLRDLRRGDRLVCGHDGIRIIPEFKDRGRADFGFMTNDVSSEKKVEWVVGHLADWIANRTGKLVVVAGPVVIHTGGGEPLAKIIAAGWVDALLAGNALAVHDVERALYGTSLGIDTKSGVPVEHGHQHHMRAINVIRLAGGLKQAVRKGLLKDGVMHSLIKHTVPYVLAGSIRDDGPLPDVITDCNAAQEAYWQNLRGAEIVLMLSSMLHSIAVGNMLPSWVKTVCVDINPSVVTKLADRGSHQAIGCVTDVGLFLHLLWERLSKTK